MAKHVGLSAKTDTRPKTFTPDQWVDSKTEKTVAFEEKQTPADVPMKRLTIDISETLHKAIKSQCAVRGVKMADEIRQLLEKHFAT